MLLVKSVSSDFNLLIENSMLGSNQIDNNVYTVGLAQTYQEILSKFFEIGINTDLRPAAVGPY